MEQSAMYMQTKGLIVEEVDGAYLLMNSTGATDVSVYLSNTAVDIFNLCDGNNSVNDVVTAIMNAYDVDYETCLQDVLQCLEALASAGIIIKKDES